MSVMTSGSEGGLEFPPADRGSGADVASESDGRVEFGVVGSREDAATASLEGDNGSGGTRVCDSVDDPRVLNLGNEENTRGGENLVSSSDSRRQGETGKVDSRNGNREFKNVRDVMVDNSSMLSDYNSFLSEFDEFAAKAKDEAVGHGYYIGDMVWGKVKSHPWWPGQIYNEVLALPSVRRNKQEGQVLVAFFGDNSYGWFDPAELIPFEENFVEKSGQTTSRVFLTAVEEGVEEVSRRRSLGLVCRCRNKDNFRPSSVDSYVVVDVGDTEPVVCGWNQISKAQDSFQPREMFSFVQQLAMQPMYHQFSALDFIKNKATALACRRAWFEEYDETYAQAFGTAPIRLPRSSALVAVDPPKAPLSGPLVIAEALRQGKTSVKPAKTKEQLEKDKYVFKKRDEPIQMKKKKASRAQSGPVSHPPLVDGSSFSDRVMHSSTKDNMHLASESTISISYVQHQPKTHRAYMTGDNKHSYGFHRSVEGGKKKIKVQKRLAGELDAGNVASVEKKKIKKIETVELDAGNVASVEKKKIKKTETVGPIRQVPLAISNSDAKVKNASGTLLRVLPVEPKLDNQKSDAAAVSSSSRSHQDMDFGKFELQRMVTDLRALALNPLHGRERSCPGVIKQVFLKYRSLVYRKSLPLSIPIAREASERSTSKYPSVTISVGPADKTTQKKIVRPVARLDDPTKGGKKRGLFDRPEDVKNKMVTVPEEIRKKQKVDHFGDTKKKIDDLRLLAAERKIPQRPIVLQRVDTKENAAKNTFTAPSKPVKLELGNRTESAARNDPAAQPKAVKVQSSNRADHKVKLPPTPTMLTMKFPARSNLPSLGELKAKFCRFGQIDHSATRIFWETSTCRMVFLHKVDAEAALQFALDNGPKIFNVNVKFYIRDRNVGVTEPKPNKIQKAMDPEPSKIQKPMEPEPRKIQIQKAKEPEPSKIQKEDAHVADTQPWDSTAADHRLAPKSAAQLAQLKSCLKKPSGDEDVNGYGRGTRVRFVLGSGWEDGEPLADENMNEIATGYSTHPLEGIGRMFPDVAPPSAICAELPPAGPRPRLLNVIPPEEQMGGAAPLMDVSQHMLNLLLKCNDVVNNLSRVLGYMPYHPL